MGSYVPVDVDESILLHERTTKITTNKAKTTKMIVIMYREFQKILIW